MSLSSALKCLYCLIKCSKYIYYIKKVICFMAIIIAAITAVTLFSGNSSLIKKLKEMI